MRLRHRARTAIVVLCAAAVAVTTPLGDASAAARVAPAAGALYLGTATEDGSPAGPVSVRVGPGGSSLVGLLGGQFHGDLCVEDPPLFAGAGGIDPGPVTLASDGRFTGSMVTAAADGARVAGTLRGRFSADARSATATLSYSQAPVSGAMTCTVTATLALRLAPVAPTGKVSPPRASATYQVVTHQGWSSSVVTDHKGKTGAIQVSAWDICHYVELPAVRFLYPEHLRATATIAHGRFSSRAAYIGGSGTVSGAVTGEFVGAGHHLTGALHIRRTGALDGNAFACDSGRVLLSAG